MKEDARDPSFFQLLRDLAEAPVLMSASGGHCSWLHLYSASSTQPTQNETLLLWSTDKAPKAMPILLSGTSPSLPTDFGSPTETPSILSA